MCLLLTSGALLHAQPASPSPTPAKTLTAEQLTELAESDRLAAKVVELHKQGKYDEAMPLAERQVAIREKILGPNDGGTAAAWINLAELYFAKKNYTEAEKLYQRILSAYEAAFGANHLNNSMIVERLALIEYLRGSFTEAETFYARALMIQERAHPEDHSDVAQAALNLGEYYRSRRAYSKAGPLFLRAIAINDKVLPRDDPAVGQAVQRYRCFLYESEGVVNAEKKLSELAKSRGPSQPPASGGGVLNGKALSLPTPAYPSEARSIHASGIVMVEITIDEKGKVIEARSICGHPVFAKPSVEAAYRARFTPTKLSGAPVQVHGIIIYNFMTP